MEKFFSPDARSKPTLDDFDSEGTLFDPSLQEAYEEDKCEKEIDFIVDTQGLSYSDARRIVELKYGRVEKPPEAEQADEVIAVNLEDRAVALKAIMSYYSQRNLARGASEARTILGNDFNRRYGDEADVVEHNMYAKLNHPSLYKSMNVLVAADAMRANGYSENEISKEKSALEEEFASVARPGKSKQREKIVKRATRTAEATSQTHVDEVA